MNDDSSVFYLPGNNLDIKVPRVERPLTAEDLTAISGYLKEVTNNPADTEDLYYQLTNRYDYAYSEFHYPYDETRWKTKFDKSMAVIERNKRRMIDNFHKQYRRHIRTDKILKQCLELLRKTHKLLIKSHEILKSTNKMATEISGTLRATNKMATEISETVKRINEKLEKYHEEDMIIMDRIGDIVDEMEGVIGLIRIHSASNI